LLVWLVLIYISNYFIYYFLTIQRFINNLSPGVAKTNSGCCGYGTMASGKVTTGYDCAVIPQASNTGKQIFIL